MRPLTVALALILSSIDAGAAEPRLGGPCDGCEAVFEGQPTTLGREASLAPAGEPGEPLVIEGTVFGADGAPAPGIVVYAYHTDAGGIYPTPNGQSGAARRHGRLRGWVRTDPSGSYRFRTIRPAAYPSRTIPAHVHMHVIEPGRATYTIDDILFDDDPLLTAGERARQAGRGGPGIVVPTRSENGTWRVRRDIFLGRNVPGYPPASQADNGR